MATQDDYIRTALRVPPALHAKIHESAKEAGRTFNAEILNRLFDSFNKKGQQEMSDIELMNDLIHKLKNLIEFAGEKVLDIEYYQAQQQELMNGGKKNS